MKAEITIQDIQRIADTFNTAKEADKGFILLPSIEGFQVFEIDKKRLETYLKIEAFNDQNKV